MHNDKLPKMIRQHTFLLSNNASLACVALIAWYAFLFFNKFSGTSLITLFTLKGAMSKTAEGTFELQELNLDTTSA